MSRSPVDLVEEFLLHTSTLDDLKNITEKLVAEDATYVSLSFRNDDLGKIAPWTGLHHGQQPFIDAFGGVLEHWENENFEITDIFGVDEKVAVFGTFTYRSRSLGKGVTSPFSVLAKVRDDKIVFFQFMEDTFGTARSFRSGGSWTVQPLPHSTPFQV